MGLGLHLDLIGPKPRKAKTNKLTLNQYLPKRSINIVPLLILLCAQVRDLELRLQQEVTRAELAEKCNAELQDQHQAACDLAHSKDQLVELGQAEISQLRESLAQANAQQDTQYARSEAFCCLLFCFCQTFSLELSNRAVSSIMSYLPIPGDALRFVYIFIFCFLNCPDFIFP